MATLNDIATRAALAATEDAKGHDYIAGAYNAAYDAAYAAIDRRSRGTTAELYDAAYDAASAAFDAAYVRHCAKR